MPLNRRKEAVRFNMTHFQVIRTTLEKANEISPVYNGYDAPAKVRKRELNRYLHSNFGMTVQSFAKFEGLDQVILVYSGQSDMAPFQAISGLYRLQNNISDELKGILDSPFPKDCE